MWADPSNDAEQIAQEAHLWLVHRAFPIWLDVGVDWRNGGYFDAIDPLTRRNCSGYKRLRVTTRQIYAFSVAANLGVAGAADAVKQGVTFLLEAHRRSDGRFAGRLDLAHCPIDDQASLYDLAFVLFALAHAYRLLGDNGLLLEARKLFDAIRENMQHPGGGYRDPDGLTRGHQQNPHMHLLEAALAWHESGVINTVPLMNEIVTLFDARFYRPTDQVIIEEFGEGWTEDNAWCEPGHHLEWIWLLDRFRCATGRAVDVTGLHEITMARSIDGRSGLLHGTLLPTGDCLSRTTRLWPHTEWLRAETVTGATHLVPAWAAVKKFLDHPVAGFWYEHWRPSERFVGDIVPASSFYHLVGAIRAIEEFAGKSVER